MKRSIIILLLILSVHISSNARATIEIKYKIGEEIITNFDILNEQKYLIFLRPELNKLSKEELEKISKNSLIREIIKKNEIKRIFKDFEDENYLKNIKKNLFKFKNVKNEKELKDLLNKKKIRYEDIIDKMKFEGLWNELIYKKYNSMVKINEEKLKNDLTLKISNEKKYEYKLSEIIFDVESKEKVDDMYSQILNYIKMNNFKVAASKFSLSNTASKGGDIGWVKETLLAEKFLNILSKLKIGEITKPIKYSNGYLIIKVNDKKIMKQINNFDKELKEIINFERNRQLNQFSLLHYKKLRQNIIINEF